VSVCPLFTGQVPRKINNLPHVIKNSAQPAVDGLHHECGFSANGYCSASKSARSVVSNARTEVSPAFPHLHQFHSGFGGASNSRSRLRSGFSPSLVRKSVQRERMFPAMCFTMTAIEFGFGVEIVNSASSGHWAIARSPSSCNSERHQ